MATRKRKINLPPAPRPISHFDKLDPRWQHLICLLFLFILPLFQYGDVIIGDKRFMAHDILQWRTSAESVYEYREEFGKEALWSENMFSGMPAYVISYKRSVPHIDDIYTLMSPVFPAAALWIMLGGLYLFFLRLKLHPLAAALGALVIAMTTYMPIIVGAGHNAKVYALTFIPWMMYGFHMVSYSKRWLLGLAVFALALTLELRAGHPQVTYFFMWLILVWWIHDLIKARKNKTMPHWVKRTGLIVAAGLIALLCNIQPYWSLYEYSPYSIRGGAPAQETTGLSIDYAMAWSQGWFELNTFIIPTIMGGSSQTGTYWGDKVFTSGPHYMGALAIFLALLALFRVKSSLKWVFFSAAVLTMLFSLGKNFSAFNYLFFNYVPFYDKFRAPEMWLMVSTFSLGTLAAMGAGWLFTIEDEKGEAKLKYIDWPAGIAVFTGVLFLFLINTTLSFDKPGERDQLAYSVAMQNNVEPTHPQVLEVVDEYLRTDIYPERKSMAQNDTFRYLLFIGIGLFLTGFFLLAKIPAWIAVSGMIIVLSIDLLSTGSRYLPDDSKISAQWDLEENIERQRRGYHTFIQDRNRERPYPYRVFPIDNNPFENAVPTYFYPSIGGYTGAKMNRYQDLIDHAISPEQGEINAGVLNMLNVRYITGRQPYRIPGYDVIYQQDDGAVLENRDVLPKVFFPDSITYADVPVDALEFVRSDFDPASVSVIERLETAEHRADTLASFDMNTYNAREISFSLSKSEPGWVVLSETYYPKGWQAFVNGDEVPIYPANFVLRGIHVDAGDHEVTFRFDPASHRIGSTLAWIFNLMLIALFGAALLLEKRKQKPDDTD